MTPKNRLGRLLLHSAFCAVFQPAAFGAEFKAAVGNTETTSKREVRTAFKRDNASCNRVISTNHRAGQQL